jgi:transmembrane sensor
MEQAPRKPLSEEILQEAATWLMEMHDGPLTPKERVRFNQWRQRSTEHEMAWQKATMLLDKFQRVPVPGAVALKAASVPSRRAAIKTLVVLLAAGPVAWTAYRLSPLSGRGDVVMTERGEHRDLVLDDGTKISLNTSTQIQVQYSDEMRRVRLLQGEILVSTAKDGRSPARPFIVETAEGLLQPLGTRFTARQLDGRSHVAVIEGAVELIPADAPTEKQRVPAGYQAAFSSHAVEPLTQCSELSLAWTTGMLVVDKMPLSVFAGELGRYRAGLLQVDAEVGKLAVSGVFPLGDTTASLTLLEQTMPVRIQYFTRYWARIVSR